MFGFRKMCKFSIFTLISLCFLKNANASEIDLNIPSLDTIFNIFDQLFNINDESNKKKNNKN